MSPLLRSSTCEFCSTGDRDDSIHSQSARNGGFREKGGSAEGVPGESLERLRDRKGLWKETWSFVLLQPGGQKRLLGAPGESQGTSLGE